MKPKFIIIGTQRGGTTSLYNYICQHPEVKPCQKKETYFFDRNYHRGMEWYEKLFPDDCVTGEATPYYMFHPLAPKRIFDNLPDVKIIILLRNPVERAYSHWKLERQRGSEPLDFEYAVAMEERRLTGKEDMVKNGAECYEHFCYSYVTKGIYAEQIQRVYDVFPREQVMVIKSEALFDNDKYTYLKVLEFLGLPGCAVELKKHNAIEGPPIEPEFRKKLVEHFRPHNQRLYDLLGYDFQWG